MMWRKGKGDRWWYETEDGSQSELEIKSAHAGGYLNYPKRKLLGYFIFYNNVSTTMRPYKTKTAVRKAASNFIRRHPYG